MTGAGTPEPRSPYGFTRAFWWSVCAKCDERIEEGEWMGLAYVADVGRRWVHQACAAALGPQRAVTRDDDPDTRRGPQSIEPGQPIPASPVAPVRIGVLGSGQWPKHRAVEVRNAIEVLARGHRQVVIVRTTRTTRTDPRGRLVGVDAWAQLTAARLGYRDEPHPDVTDVLAAHLDLAVAFPLHADPASGDGARAGRVARGCDTRRAMAAADAAGIAVFTHA